MIHENALPPYIDREMRARFDATMLPHLDAVFRVAMWFIRDRTAAEDLAQHTFSQALRSFQRFEPGANARAWLLTILCHQRATRCRANRCAPWVPHVSDHGLGSVGLIEQPPQQDAERHLLDALRQLPLDLQEILLLRDVEDLSCREVAGVLHLPTGTVISRLDRARELLRTSLSDARRPTSTGLSE